MILRRVSCASSSLSYQWQWTRPYRWAYLRFLQLSLGCDILFWWLHSNIWDLGIIAVIYLFSLLWPGCWPSPWLYQMRARCLVGVVLVRRCCRSHTLFDLWLGCFEALQTRTFLVYFVNLQTICRQLWRFGKFLMFRIRATTAFSPQSFRSVPASPLPLPSSVLKVSITTFSRCHVNALSRPCARRDQQETV